MKNLKPKEVALVVFAAVCIFGAQFFSFVDFLVDSKTLGVIITILWSLYYAILIITCIKNSERRLAVLATIFYFILLFVLLFTLVFPK